MSASHQHDVVETNVPPVTACMTCPEPIQPGDARVLVRLESGERADEHLRCNLARRQRVRGGAA